MGESLASPTTQDQGANNRTLLNAAERAADPDRYTSWKGQFPDLSQFYGQPWAGDNVVQAVDRSQDIQLAAGNGFRMGNGRINVSEPVNGRVYISDGLGSLSDADLIARTRAVLGQGNSATSARVNYLAAEAEATSNLYASGMGDVRTVLTMQGSSGDALQRITAQPIESLPSITAMNGWDSFLTFNPAGKLLSGVGGGVADLVQAPVVLAKEALLTTSDTIGQSVTGALNWLTDSNLNYRSDSALYRSIQTNGVLGTAGLAVTGTVKGIVAPIDALYRNDVNAFGRSLPGAAMATVGPLAKFGNAATDLSPGAALREKYSYLTPEARATRMEVLAEANAARRLQELESSIPGAHFVEKHGAQTTLQSQLERAQFGRNPTTGIVETYPNGNPKIPSSATRFVSNRDQLNAINRAQNIFEITGDVTLAERPISFDYLMGEGYKKTSLLYGQSYSAQVWFRNGVPVTAFPIWGQ